MKPSSLIHELQPKFFLSVAQSLENLRDLCLEGTLAPELGKLTNVKCIILRNNSFYGTIPQEIGDLKELKVLDLGYNNFTGPFTSNLVNNLSLSILCSLLDNNNFLIIIHQK